MEPTQGPNFIQQADQFFKKMEHEEQFKKHREEIESGEAYEADMMKEPIDADGNRKLIKLFRNKQKGNLQNQMVLKKRENKTLLKFTHK